MNYYFAKCNELNFLLCIKNGLWAQQINRMKNWKPKDKLILYTENGIAGLFEVTSKQFIDHIRIWTDKSYPYRVNINPLKVLSTEDRIPLTEHNIKNELADKTCRPPSSIFAVETWAVLVTIPAVTRTLGSHKNNC